MAKRQKTKPPPTLESILTRFYGGLLTPQQTRKQARRDTNLAMQDSMRQLRTTYQRERERTLREQYAQGAWAGLLRGYGAEGSAESETIKNAYAKAAGLTEAESRGFITPTIAQQQANVGAGQTASENLAGYRGDIGSVQPGVNAGVLNYLAALPKGTFAAQAEAAAKGLGRAGAEAGGEFALREAQLGQTLRELQDSYTMGVRDLQAKRPGMLQEALGRYGEGTRQDYATLLSGLGLMNTQQGNLLDYSADIQGQRLDARTSARDTKRKAMAARGLDINGRPLPGYYKAPNGRILEAGTYVAADGSIQKVPQGYKVGPKGKLVKAPYPSSSGGGAGSKADKTRNDYVERTRDKMLSAAKAAPLYGENPYTGVKGPLQGVTRAKARQYLLQTYGQQAISRYPGQKAAIMRMIENILTNLGYEK